jgi:perosamine synthetase
VAAAYDDAFSQQELVKPLGTVPYGVHAYHLYVVRVNTKMTTRAKFFASLRSQGIGVNVHYIPVHLHPYYREHLGTKKGMCPVAEEAYEQIVSLPMYATLTDDEVRSVVEAVRRAGS